MSESFPEQAAQKAVPLPMTKSRWGIAFAIGWTLLLLLVMPFHVFPLEIRVGVTIASLAALYFLYRSLRGWHYLWAIPLVLFWLVANYTLWTFRYWSEEDYRKDIQERSERIKHRQNELPFGDGARIGPIK